MYMFASYVHVCTTYMHIRTYIRVYVQHICLMSHTLSSYVGPSHISQSHKRQSLMWDNPIKDNPTVMSYRVRSSLYIYMHIPLYTYMYIPLYISMHTPFICIHVYIAYTYIRFYVRTNYDEEYCSISLQGDRA